MCWSSPPLLTALEEQSTASGEREGGRGKGERRRKRGGGEEGGGRWRMDRGRRRRERERRGRRERGMMASVIHSPSHYRIGCTQPRGRVF